MKKVKFPKKYKYGFRLIGLPTTKNLLFDRWFYPKWLLKPICLFKGHQNKIFWPHGLKVKQCIRCGKFHYKKETTEKPIKLGGEIGEISGVRFITT